MTKKPKDNEIQRPARPYDDVPLVGNTPPRCVRCNRALYGNVVQSPLCPFCDFDDAEADLNRHLAQHAAAMQAIATLNTPATPIDGSKVSPGDVWDTVEVGWRDDAAEVEYIPIDDDTPQEWVEDVDYGEDVA